jgi:propanol-preferring alcohol dehydrogenase
VKLPIFQTVLNGITVVGSIVGARADLREVSRCTRRAVRR